jgi:acyl dehydratase
VRYLEDLSEGETGEYGPHVVSEEEILAFAQQWDPQWFHTDPAAAKESIYGGLIASGIHTLAVMSRLLVQGWAGALANLGSPGLDEVELLRPVRPGDALWLRLRVRELRASVTRPDRGILRLGIVLFDGHGAEVLRTGTTLMVKRRATPDGAGSAASPGR